tara:strand:- start:2396 stop:3199 length:804 start_codon:yes stop_codon:yes gene_type:complete
MKKVLIIGGNRFVGKLVSKELDDKGYDITLLNRSGTSPVNSAVIRQDRNHIDKVTLHQLINYSPEIVIDMCAYDVTQVKKLLSSVNTDNLSQYIIVSSIASEYSFFGDYGRRKAEIELFFRFDSDIPYVIIRPTYIIGKNDPHKRIDYFLDNISRKNIIRFEGDGDENLSFVFVEDVAKVIIDVVKKEIVNKTYNVGNDEVISCRELTKLFFRIMNNSTVIVYSYIDEKFIFRNKECVFSNNLTKKDLGIKFKSLETGIHEYIISKS